MLHEYCVPFLCILFTNCVFLSSFIRNYQCPTKGVSLLLNGHGEFSSFNAKVMASFYQKTDDFLKPDMYTWWRIVCDADRGEIVALTL